MKFYTKIILFISLIGVTFSNYFENPNSEFNCANYQPIVVNSEILHLDESSIGDEIGIFDGDNCVGSGTITAEEYIIIYAWTDCDDNSGFIEGNEITIKHYNLDSNEVLTDFYLDWNEQENWSTELMFSSGSVMGFQIVYNSAPQIISDVISQMGDTTHYYFEIIVDDYEVGLGDELTFTALQIPYWTALVQINDNTAILQGVPTEVGSYPISFIVQDEHGLQTGLEYNLEIIDVPAFIPPTSQECENYQPFIISTNILNYEEIPYFDEIGIFDGENCVGSGLITEEEYILVYARTNCINGNGFIPGNSFKIQLFNYDLKEYDKNIFLNWEWIESQGWSTTGEFNSNDVTGIQLVYNSHPEILSEPQLQIGNNSSYEYEIIANDIDFIYGDSLHFYGDILPEWLSLEQIDNFTASITGSVEESGTYPVRIVVEDNADKKSEQYFIIVVSSEDAVPTVNFPQKIDLFEDQPQLIDFNDYVENPTTDALEIQILLSENILLNCTELTCEASSALNWNGIEIIDLVITNNNDFFYSTHLIFEVHAVNDLPEVALPSHITFGEDENFLLNLTDYILDPDLDELNIQNYHSENLTVQEIGQVWIIESNNNWSGNDTLHVEVHDNIGDVVNTSIVIIIEPQNLPPQISIPTQYIISEDESIEISLNDYCTDIDGDDISYSISGMENLNTNLENGLLSIQPTENWNGIEVLNLIATDSINEPSNSPIQFIIQPINDPPEPLFITKSLNEDSEKYIDLFSDDIDNDLSELTYNILQAPNHALEFIVNDNQIFYRPESNFFGLDSVVIQVEDADQATSPNGILYLNVLPQNDIPLIDDFEIISEAENSVQFDVADFIEDIETNDPDLIFDFLLQYPNGNGKGALGGHLHNIDGTIWEYNSNDNSYLFDFIPFRVVDEEGQQSLTSVMTISNLAGRQMNSRMIIADSSSFSVEGNNIIELEFIGMDFINQEQVEINIPSQFDFGTLSDISDPIYTDGLTTVTALFHADNVNSTENIQYQIENSNGTSNGFISIQITSVNMPPQINGLEDFSIMEGENLNFEINFSDPDSPQLTWEFGIIPNIDGINVNWVNINDNTLNVIYQFPDQFAQTVLFQITATDDTGLSEAIQHFVNVEKINDPPVLTLPDTIIFNEDEVHSEFFSLYAYDPDFDQLTVSSEISQNIIVNIDDGNVVHFSSIEDWYGSEVVHFTVSDNQNRAVASDSVAIQVQSINDNPTINLDDSIIFEEDDEFELIFNNLIYDIDSENININVLGNSQIQYNQTDSSIIFSAHEHWYGQESIIIQAVDPELAMNIHSLEVIIEEINDIPVAQLPDTVQFFEDDTMYLFYSAYISDVDDTDLDIHISNSEHILSEKINDSFQFISKEEHWNGFDSVYVNIDDGRGGEISSKIIIQMNPVNDAPFLLGSIPNFELMPNDSATLDLNLFFDYEGDELSFSFNSSNENIANIELVNESAIIYTSNLGDATISITVTDESGAIANENVNVMVSNLIYGCDGIANSGLIFDECGVCDGSGPEDYYDCDGICLIDTDGDNVCDQLEIYGCTNPIGTNYNPDATEDDNSCEMPSSESVIWRFDVSAKIFLANGDVYNDPFNRFGFYYSSTQQAVTHGELEMLPIATDYYDPFWDIPEPQIPNMTPYIQFYFENNWDDYTNWGHLWAYDIRAFNDDLYANNQTTEFNGVLTSNSGGIAILTIKPEGQTKLNPESDQYIPVYLKVTGGGYDENYFKIEDEISFPVNISPGNEVSFDFIVGNQVPHFFNEVNLNTSQMLDISGEEWKPSNNYQFTSEAACENVNLNQSHLLNQLTGTDFPAIKCNDYSQRYPAIDFTLNGSINGQNTFWEVDFYEDVSVEEEFSGIDENLQFNTNYQYSIIPQNKAGIGEPSSFNITTISNAEPSFTDMCLNENGYPNDCEELILTTATSLNGDEILAETNFENINNQIVETHLYHTYKSPHDGCGKLNGCGEGGDEPGIGLDGIDYSGTPIVISLLSEFSDLEGYDLESSWDGDVEFSIENIQSTIQSSSLSLPFAEPNTGGGSIYEFSIEITDDDWLMDGDFGVHKKETSVTIQILPEPNEAPIAVITPHENILCCGLGDADAVGGSYWQVPHNGDNGDGSFDSEACDPLVEYNEDSNCDDNKATISMDALSSYDLDCECELNEDSGEIECAHPDGNRCEMYNQWWSITEFGNTFNDLNGNGVYDSGEPCSGCIDSNWEFNTSGVLPSVNPGNHIFDDEVSSRLATGGYIWNVTVQDNYGATDRETLAFYILPEPNTRAEISEETEDVNSDFTVYITNPFSDNQIHFLPPFSEETTVTIESAEVFDFDNDWMTHWTLLNGEEINRDTCKGDCQTLDEDYIVDLGVGIHTVTTCVQDSYEGYEYLVYASGNNGQNQDVDGSVTPIVYPPNCEEYTFEIQPEPTPIHVSSLEITNQGLTSISMSWNPSDFASYPNDDEHGEYAQLNEFGENAIYYIIERTQTPDDTDSWHTITEIPILKEYISQDCTGKFDSFENYSDSCQDPTISQAIDDGEWYFMGRDSISGKFYFLDEGLENNTVYFYRMFAVNSNGLYSKIGNVVQQSTEAIPEISLSRDMFGEIYAVGENTNPIFVNFTTIDGLNGHNISKINSSYTTNVGIITHEDPFSGGVGILSDGPSIYSFSYPVTANASDHQQEIEICVEDAGDYWGYNRTEYCLNSGEFSGSETTLQKEFQYKGWHLFSSPLYKNTSISNVFSEGLEGLSLGGDYIWFNEFGNFAEFLPYQFGEVIILGLNPDFISFQMYGNLLSSILDDNDLNDLDNAEITLEKGWNLISSKIVRPTNKNNFIIVKDSIEYNWTDAHELGIVSGDLLTLNQFGYYETNTFSPWKGYWVHVSNDCVLIPSTSEMQLAKNDLNSENSKNWEMTISAMPVGTDGLGDIIKLGMSENATTELVDNEDVEDIPQLIPDNNGINLYFKNDLNQRYWKNYQSYLNNDQDFKLWKIHLDNGNGVERIKLNWSIEDLGIDVPIQLFYNGNSINLLNNTELEISNDVKELLLIVGDDSQIYNLGIPQNYSLLPAYPNPFNPETTLKFELPVESEIFISVYDVKGHLIDEILNSELPAGYHKIKWDATGFPSGVYFVKMVSGDPSINSGKGFTQSQKIVLMK